MNTHDSHHHNLGQVEMYLPFTSQRQVSETTCSLARHSSCFDRSIVTGSAMLTPREGERNRSLTSYLIFQYRGPFSVHLTGLPVGEKQFVHIMPLAPNGLPTTPTICHVHLTNPSLQCTIRPDPKGRREESVAGRFISSFSFYAYSTSEVIP
jgi:hypothetical protein